MAASTFKTLKVTHPEMGEVKVKVDAEDVDMLKNLPLYVKMDYTTANYKPRIAIMFSNEPRLAYAHRLILEEHKLLDYGRNYRPKNGDWFDLRKKNFI